MYYAAKGAAALGVGMLAGKMLGGNKAAMITNSSLTVTAHDLIKQFAAANLSSVPVGMYPTLGRVGGMRGMPGGRVLPPLPQMQSLRRYSGSTSDQVYTGAVSALRMYPSANARDNANR